MSKAHIPTLTISHIHISRTIRHAADGGGDFADYQIVTSSLLFNSAHFISAPLVPSGDLSRRYHSPLATAIGVCIGQIRCINC